MCYQLLGTKYFNIYSDDVNNLFVKTVMQKMSWLNTGTYITLYMYVAEYEWNFCKVCFSIAAEKPKICLLCITFLLLFTNLSVDRHLVLPNYLFQEELLYNNFCDSYSSLPCTRKLYEKK